MHVGNLYYYFRNKQELLAYCQKQTLAGLLERAETISRSSLPPDAKLFWLIVEHVVQLNEITPGSLAHLDVEALDQPLRRQILAHRDRYEAGLRSLVEEGIRVGLFRPVDPKVTVMAVLGATNWTVKWYKPGGDRSIQGIGREFAAMLVRGLLTEGRELSDPKMFDRSKAHEHT